MNRRKKKNQEPDATSATGSENGCDTRASAPPIGSSRVAMMGDSAFSVRITATDLFFWAWVGWADAHVLLLD